MTDPIWRLKFLNFAPENFYLRVFGVAYYRSDFGKDFYIKIEPRTFYTEACLTGEGSTKDDRLSYLTAPRCHSV